MRSGFADAVLTCGVSGRQPRSLRKQFFAQGAGLVGGFVGPAFLQFGYQQFNDIFKRPGRFNISKVEAIDAGVFHPRLQGVGDLLRIARHHRTSAAQSDKFDSIPDLPNVLRIKLAEGGQRELPGLGVDIT